MFGLGRLPAYHLVGGSADPTKRIMTTHNHNAHIQAAFDHHYDSLCGMKDPAHPMHDLYLEARRVWAAVDTRKGFLDSLAETRDPLFLRALDDYMGADEPRDELDTEYLQRFAENA